MAYVKIYLPFYTKNCLIEPGDEIEINEGATLHDLFKVLKIPFPNAAVFFCRVNYKPASMKTVLKDGDIVSFLSLIIGG